jgi:hypothetical protein
MPAGLPKRARERASRRVRLARLQRTLRRELWAQRGRVPGPRSEQGGRVPLASTWTADLAEGREATHVSGMQALTNNELVGFMELQVGSLAVQVPIRAADPTPALPLASFEVDGEGCAILIRGDSSSKAVERAMGDAAREAVAHLSRKLLN